MEGNRIVGAARNTMPLNAYPPTGCPFQSRPLLPLHNFAPVLPLSGVVRPLTAKRPGHGVNLILKFGGRRIDRAIGFILSRRQSKLSFGENGTARR